MLVDSHCHLDFADFEPERDAVVQRALDAGIKRMVTISTRVRKFDAIRTLAETYEAVYCSVGTHPNNAHEELDITADDLVRLAEHPKVVAIGEAGLDYHYDYAPKEAQQQGFLAHIDAARRTQLPLVIHARSADIDMAEILEKRRKRAHSPLFCIVFLPAVRLRKKV